MSEAVFVHIVLKLYKQTTESVQIANSFNHTRYRNIKCVVKLSTRRDQFYIMVQSNKLFKDHDSATAAALPRTNHSNKQDNAIKSGEPLTRMQSPPSTCNVNAHF